MPTGKRIVIIHGWMGSPSGEFLPWLKKRLEAKGYEVLVPKMPNTNHPKIDEWVAKLSKTIEVPDGNTFLVGHSIGGKLIPYYLLKLKEGQMIGGALIVASWINVRTGSFKNARRARMMAQWLEMPVGWKKMLLHTTNFRALYSDNDPWIPISAAATLKKMLGAKVVVVHQGHFYRKRSNVVLREVLKMVKGAPQRVKRLNEKKLV
ncbi:MAG: alpha/beta hydrolase [Candidatus Micrarchaeota archaeon]|nr:alpha/beta hydrolase [Candidatus Micrarchaeota archaeon]MDE1848030.1 alpha/beta hydrolase [Candidatus Micrarchaeota archaeon]MDE1864593.1 alpha/beta hydrolase [Candidatus Micrarchaeota archaeon]